MTTPAPRTTRVWGDPVNETRCRAEACQAPIWFAVNVVTGRAMPFDGTPTALSIERDPATGLTVWVVDLGLSHFASCPAASGFRTRDRVDDRTPSEKRGGSRRYEGQGGLLK